MNIVMVVDDDRDILEVMAAILTINGYKPITLNDGNNLLPVIEETVPALIILDIQLGDTDGRELCKIIKGDERFKHIPLILFSANRQLYDNEENHCCNVFLEKPFDVHNLMKLINDYSIQQSA